MVVRRSARYALWVTLMVTGALILTVGIFVFRAMTGPVSLGLLTPRLEAMINEGLKDIQLRFGDSVIEWSEGRSVAHLQFIDVEALDRKGNVIARVPRANVSLSGPALLNGEAAPTRVELIGASALIVRRADGGVQLGLQVDDTEKPSEATTSEGVSKAMLEAMLKPNPDDALSRNLTRFAVRDAKLTIFDQETKSYWTAEKGALTFDRKPGGVVVSVTAPLRLADKSTWVFTAAAHYKNGTEKVALEAAFNPVRLSLLSASGAGLKALNGINIPVKGNASCDLSMSGQLGQCKLHLNAGAGTLKLPALKKEPLEFKHADLTVNVDFPNKRYAIETAKWQGKTIRGQIGGEGVFEFAPDGALANLTADWTAKDVSVDAPNVFDGSLALETANLRANFNAASGRLTIEEILAKRGDFVLTLAGELQDNPVSMGVVLNGGFKQLTVSELKRLWPSGAAPGARDWISENVHEGLVREGTVAVNIPAGAAPEFVADEMMNIAFSIEGMRVTYLNGLPDVTNAKGSATLLGDTFKAEIAEAKIGTVQIKGGTVTIPELHSTNNVGTVTATASGPTKDLLLIIDKPRLGYPTRYGIKAAEAGGTAEVQFSIGVPMLKEVKTEDIAIDVAAELKDIRLPVKEDMKITGGTFAINLDTKGMKAHGAVFVNQAPMGFTWTEDFTGTAPIGTRIDVTSTLNDAQRDSLGLGTSGYIEGKTKIIASFVGRGGKFTKAKLDANLETARLAIPELGWAKPEDANATLKADIVFKPEGGVEIANIDLQGQGVKAAGRVLMRGTEIAEADFTKILLGTRNDFAVTYRAQEDGPMFIDAKGRVIDAGGLFDGDDDEDAPKPKKDEKQRKRPLYIKASFDTAYLQGDVAYTGLKLDYGDDGQRLTSFKIDAGPDASKIRGELTRAPDNSRHLKFQTGDAGRFVKGVTGFRSLIGGDLTLNVDLSPLPRIGVAPSRAETAFDGTLKIENFTIVDQPFFARLLSAGSFTGLGDLLRGEGVTFTKLEQPFQGRGDRLTLTNGRAAGPSIGLTTQGTIDRDTDKIDLNGTIVPLYGLNSMFEDIPLIGDILQSRKGEGIFGVTYGVSGEVNELRVAVNPISMLAPGFLRQVFQMGPTPQAEAPMMPAPAPTITAPAQPPQPARPEAQNALTPTTKTN